jgi:hypothetical protein
MALRLKIINLLSEKNPPRGAEWIYKRQSPLKDNRQILPPASILVRFFPYSRDNQIYFRHVVSQVFLYQHHPMINVHCRY